MDIRGFQRSHRLSGLLFAGLVLLCTHVPAARAQGPSPAAAPAPQDAGKVMLTIFLRHDQSKTLGEINAQLDKNGFRQAFPPEGVEVVSWYIVMGIGQVVTLRMPAEKLRAVNRMVEEKAWGAYRTDFYATYDFKPIAEAERKKAEKPK
ncbi:MAG TPA: hypothetical protein VN874_08255 [Myxococcales bacterium]|nr:hypothetical protein [Myxococcales bacterium]